MITAEDQRYLLNGTIDDFIIFFKEDEDTRQRNTLRNMKKISFAKNAYLKRKQVATRTKTIRIANIRKMRRLKAKYANPLSPLPLSILKKERKAFVSNFYDKVEYQAPSTVVDASGSIGLELDSDIESYFQFAASFIGSHSKKIEFKFKECTRIWPSGIALLCSFAQWVGITSKEGKAPVLLSTDADDDKVNTYLTHCGFYDYVKRPNFHFKENSFLQEETVKIEHIYDKKKIDVNENEILELLQKFSALGEEEQEKFGDIILTEVFNNVDEHGCNYVDRGWWTITQRHPRTGIISLSVADNGIGIKNSLKTGPQKSELEKRFGRKDPRKGKYLEASLEENISGAIKASRKDNKKNLGLKRSYMKGARRGNGLNRIKEACKDCKIKFKILSQGDFICIDETGTIKKIGTHSKRIFAGTLYHFVIPAKQEKRRTA